MAVEPEPEPLEPEIAAPGERRGQQGRWNRNNIFTPVSRIDHSRTPVCVELANPAVSGDRAAAFVDREIDQFYRNQDSTVPALPDLAFWVVWAAPERFRPEDYAGLHFGVGNRAYRGIVASNCGRVENLEWRRVTSLSEARRIYIQEIDNHVVRIPGFRPWRPPIGNADRIFLWR